MSGIAKRSRELMQKKRLAIEARYPRLRRQIPTVRQAPPMRGRVGNTVVLGSDERDLPFRLDERSRLEHMHVIGTTGGGKTNLIEHMVRQDILNGRGVCVVDPHGGHPDSLYRHLVTWLGKSGIAGKRTVHLIDPNANGYLTGFNPLSVPADHDPAVVAEAALEAFERLWGDEDPDSKPTIQRVLSGTFTALAELGLTLAEARLLFDPEDQNGLREYVLCEVQDEYAQEELGWLHAMGNDRAGLRDLRVEVTGPRNRIAKLVRLEALRTVIGQTGRVIDLRQAMDEGHIILANLSGGAHAYEKGSDILGRLLIRFVLFHAKRRLNPHRPFFVYLDECQRYLSGDVPTTLAEVRKQGIGMILAHQWQSQLAKVDEEILSAVRSGTNIKVVFRVKDQKEAMDLAEMVIPLNLEMPVEVLTKETVVGYEVRRMNNASTGGNRTQTRSNSTTKTTGTGVTETEGESVAESTTRTESEQESWAETHGTSRSVALGETETHGTTVSHTESEGDSESEGTTFSSGSSRSRGGATNEQRGSSSGSNFSQSFDDVPMDQFRSGEEQYRRAARNQIDATRSVSAGYNDGENYASGNSENWSDSDSESESYSTQHGHSSSVSDGTAESETYGTSRSVTEGENESFSHGITRGVSIANGVTNTRSTSTAHSRQESTGITTGDSTAAGQSWSSGWSETLAPVLAMRASAVHSKDNVLYMAAQKLRSLKTGVAFINFVDHTGMNSALLRVPHRKMPALTHDAFAALLGRMFAVSPSAQPIERAKAALLERRLKLIAAANAHKALPPEPVKPSEFRVRLVKDRNDPDVQA